MWGILLTVLLAAWPVEPHPVLAGFDPPASPWAAGHRGVDFPAAAGDPVRAVQPGSVAFAGSVAGKPVLVIALDDGRRVTYEPVVAEVGPGARVGAGQRVGRVAGWGGHCAGRCLHLGLILGQDYLDPMSVLPRPPAVLKPVGRAVRGRPGRRPGPDPPPRPQSSRSARG